MAATKVSVKVKPSLQEVRKRLQTMRREVMDIKSPLAKAAIYLDQWVQRNFKSEGGEVGGWVPFKKNKAGIPLVEVQDPGRKPAKLLQKSGRLRLSFAPFSDGKVAGIGSDLPYAKTHHKGEGHVPERQLLPDKGTAKRTVQQRADQILRAHVKGALSK